MSNVGYAVAVLGATGEVGNTFIKILEQRQFPVSQLYPLASHRSIGREVQFHDQVLLVEDVATFDFSQVQLALFSAGADTAQQYAPRAVEQGAVVIDNSSQFRYQKEVPLIVPEVNSHRIADYRHTRIIANPNCSTIQMVVALNPVRELAGIARINVATYQSVSGAGKRGIDELVQQTSQMLSGVDDVSQKCFPQTIAFNAIPHIDQFQDNGYTREEMKMVWETHKIFEDEEIQINPTCVRVPVLYSHSEAIHIETHKPITVRQAEECLRQAPGIIVMENSEEYPTAVTHANGEDAVYVGRLRQDISHPQGLSLWVVADNTRKGAALNGVQIAELVIHDFDR